MLLVVKLFFDSNSFRLEWVVEWIKQPITRLGFQLEVGAPLREHSLSVRVLMVGQGWLRWKETWRDLIIVDMIVLDGISVMDWLSQHLDMIDCMKKRVLHEILVVCFVCGLWFRTVVRDGWFLIWNHINCWSWVVSSIWRVLWCLLPHVLWCRISW